QPVTPQPPTLWERYIALFTGNKAGASKSSRLPKSERFERERGGRQPHKPESIEVTSPKLYIGNLSFHATESDLFDLFNGVGKVQSAEIVSHKYTEKSKGFAFVTMTSIAEAKRAVSELHDKDFMGRKLVVSGAKSGESRGACD
ncbi:MAG: hypothetical protein QOD99_2571, partial [Chthoniobacter sp.]|nr:hypothetical protein [Chthoniobacter sp.]